MLTTPSEIISQEIKKSFIAATVKKLEPFISDME
jgi:hypothetical protein